MSDKLFRILIIIFSSGIIVFPVLLLSNPRISTNPDILFPLLMIVFLLTVIPIPTILSIWYKDHRGFRRSVWIIFVAGIISSALFGIFLDLGFIFFLSVTITIVCLLIAVFIFDKKRMNLYVYILLGITAIGLVVKKYHLPGSNLAIISSHVILAVTFMMIGFKSAFLIKNNRPLVIISIICCSVIFISCLVIIFKIQHWPGADLFFTYSIIPILLMTVIVLVYLPQSGYVNWKKNHKNFLLKTIMVPWIYLLLFFSARFALPSKTLDVLFEGQEKQKIHFNMVEYDTDKAGDTEGK